MTEKTASPSEQAPAVQLESVRYSWENKAAPDLEIDSLEIARGDRLFVEGPSGSGKSTLLGLLAGVTTPQKGTVSILSEPINTRSAAERDRFRADHIGYLFQMFNLVPYLSVLENVTLPLRFSDRRRTKCGGVRSEAIRLLNHLGMDAYRNRRVTKLSVGQQQRVAAARALIGAPELVLADEPTSALDPDHSQAFIELLFEECERAGSTLVFVSHDPALSVSFGQVFRLNGASAQRGADLTDRSHDS